MSICTAYPLRASLWIGQKSVFDAFMYLYFISDISSDIIVQTHHQINIFRDLGFICLEKWKRKRTADHKWGKCGALKASMGGFCLRWRAEELAAKRGISEEQLCHVMAAQLLQTPLQHWRRNGQPAFQEGVLHHFIIHDDVSNMLTRTEAATS